MATRRHDRKPNESRRVPRLRSRGNNAGSSGLRAVEAEPQLSPQASSVQTPSSSGSQSRMAVVERRATINRPDSGKPKKLRQRGMGLRAKFTLVLSVVTALALMALGVSMALTTDKFLFGQKQHSGVEVARFVAQIGTATNARLKWYKDLQAKPELREVGLPTLNTEDIKRDLLNYLNHARDWGGNNDFRFSDVLAIRFECPVIPEIHGVGVGDMEDSTEKVEAFTSIYVPKIGSAVTLPPGITVQEQRKKIGGGEIPIYRFKIALDKSFGQSSDGKGPNVRVDIAAESVKSVRNNLFITIGIAAMIAICVVVMVASWLAGNITRPLDMLISDMKIVARGRLEHETKAHSSDEIGLLASEFNRMTSNLKIAQSALVEQEKADYELSIAREVQRQLLPADAPTILGFDSAAFYQGAKAVSGDYFDFIPLGNGLWGFIIADVSGKGIPGSMVMAVTRTIVRLVANKHQNRAAETLKETNRLISKQIKSGMFVTAFYAILDENTSTVTYASAGHNPMVIYRAATGAYELTSSKGIALGFNGGPIFDKTIQEKTTVLEAGDCMVLYTDGFPEAMNSTNQEFGDEKFYELVARHGRLDARGVIAKLVEAISVHRGSAEQSDDLTIIAVRNTAKA
jgi:serine phosphatase RsbU (regulator of sigma subunit)